MKENWKLGGGAEKKRGNWNNRKMGKESDSREERTGWTSNKSTRFCEQIEVHIRLVPGENAEVVL